MSFNAFTMLLSSPLAVMLCLCIYTLPNRFFFFFQGRSRNPRSALFSWAGRFIKETPPSFTRQSVHTVPAIRKAKKAIRKAFENSMNGKGSNLVEIVSTCNSGWKMTPQASNDWMVEHMFPFYPLGDLKNKE